MPSSPHEPSVRYRPQMHRLTTSIAESQTTARRSHSGSRQSFKRARLRQRRNATYLPFIKVLRDYLQASDGLPRAWPADPTVPSRAAHLFLRAYMYLASKVGAPPPAFGGDGPT